MNLWNLLSKYPASVIFYAIYMLFFTLSIMKEREYQLIIQHNHGVWPYGVREDGFLFPFLGGAFLFVSCGNAIVTKENKFYLWLIALIIVPFSIWIFYLNM